MTGDMTGNLTTNVYTLAVHVYHRTGGHPCSLHVTSLYHEAAYDGGIAARSRGLSGRP